MAQQKLSFKMFFSLLRYWIESNLNQCMSLYSTIFLRLRSFISNWSNNPDHRLQVSGKSLELFVDQMEKLQVSLDYSLAKNLSNHQLDCVLWQLPQQIGLIEKWLWNLSCQKWWPKSPAHSKMIRMLPLHNRKHQWWFGNKLAVHQRMWFWNPLPVSQSHRAHPNHVRWFWIVATKFWVS